MKVCLKWTNLGKRLKDADEISIKYIEDKGLLQFMEKYANKRIILKLETNYLSDIEVKKLVAIKKQYPDYNFTIGLPNMSLPMAMKLKEFCLPFYFLEPIQDWETLSYYVKDLGVSDINLSGALGFELPKVKRFLEKVGAKVNVRITPNFAMAISQVCSPFQMFFVRPEDLELYEQYVDVVEFAGTEHQDTFYNIYIKQKAFIGRLDQVIYNLPLSTDNLGLTNLFGERRIGCGRECLNGGRCKRCFSMDNIAKKMGPVVREKIKENIKEKSNEI